MPYTPLVVFICVAFLFMFLCMQWLVVVPLFRDYELRGVAVAVLTLYTLVWSMSTWSYKLCIEVHPGRPPLDYVPPGATESELREERQRALQETLSPIEPEFDRLSRRFAPVRFCKPCGAFKPPRAAHCKSCNACCLLFDHCCPFIGGCLGYFNRKVFQLFLWYTVLGAALSFALYCWRLIVVMSALSRATELADRRYLLASMILIIVQFVILFVVIFAVGSLAAHQFNMLLLNTTSVEYRQYRHDRYDAIEAGRPFRWRYDVGGSWANFKSCMGNSIPAMLWPSVPTGDGYSWRTAI